MREAPRVESSDPEIVVMDVESRRDSRRGHERGDWYVTWVTRSRPWEISVMRLSGDELTGTAWHHGQRVAFRVFWQRPGLCVGAALTSDAGIGSVPPASAA